MPEWRSDHTATLLLNGKVLVAGGMTKGGYLASTTLYDPATGQWTATGSMPEARYGHTATLLPNGKVLVAGGVNYSGYLASATLYDPATGQWTAKGSMPEARYRHTATLLPNGKVLVAGGQALNTVLASAALYDPATGQWTVTGSMPEARDFNTATLLPNGKVLVAGGQILYGFVIASAALYDPATGQWTATGSMPETRHSHTATLLLNGKVLVAGGENVSASLAGAALYDPTTGQWTATGPMPEAREVHTATLLPNGKVLVAGGQTFSTVLAGAALYDPATGQWTDTGSMHETREVHTATLLPNGKVLVAGGVNASVGLASAELYTPDTGGPKDPDFTITALTLTPASPTLNTAFTATVTVKNQGKTAGDGGQLVVWTNQSATPACGVNGDQSVAIGTLAAGASKTLTVTGLKSTTAGTKTFRAFADDTCATLESNESNNQRTLSYRIHGGADFTVSAITLNPASPKANSAFTATLTVTNQGTAAGDAGYLDVWADQPNAQACGTDGDAWAGIGSLAAGASKTVKVSLLAGTSGAKTLRAFVDSWCGTAESNESNNQVIQGYTVP